jgi:hypothetical protein
MEYKNNKRKIKRIEGWKITTKQGQAFLNGEKWDGEWITITK